MFNPINIFSKLIKSSNQRELDRVQKIIKDINLLEKNIKNMEDSEFPKKTDELIESGLKDIDILPLLNFLYANNVKYINWKKKNILKKNNNSLIFYKNNKANRKVINNFLKVV